MLHPEKCNGKPMLYDQACLHVYNRSPLPAHLFKVSAECYKCTTQPWADLEPDSLMSFTVSTVYPEVIKYQISDFQYFNKFDFEQHGHYRYDLFYKTEPEFKEMIQPPTNPYTPLYWELAVIFVIFILWKIGSFASGRVRLPRFLRTHNALQEAEEDLGAISRRSRSGDSIPLIPAEPVRISRTKSLDVLRGLIMTAMLFVNYGGGKYSVFEHAPWNGVTFADFIFPSFAWIMGISLVLTVSSQLRNAVSRKRLFLKIVMRSLSLIVIGLCLNSYKNNNLTTLRVPGVLQRLGLSFLIVGTLETFLSKPQAPLMGRWVLFGDVINSWVQWIIMLGIVAVHTVLTFQLTPPGCPRGYLGPGGFHDNGTHMNCTGGAAGLIDRVIFGPRHLYSHPTFVKVYGPSLPFDPEGLLGTLTTAFTVFLGVAAGRIFIFFRSSFDRCIRWIIMALITGIIGLYLCGGTQEAGTIPLNKNLWSLSFVLVSSSISVLLFTILYLLIDDRRWCSGTPFEQVGRNSILLYIGETLTKEVCPWNWTPVDRTTHTELLIVNTWSTVLWILIAVVLYQYNIFITI